MTSKSSDKNGRNQLMVYGEYTCSVTKKSHQIACILVKEKRKRGEKKAEMRCKFSNMLHPGLSVFLTKHLLSH